MKQIDGIAKDSGYKGVNLLDGGTLTVKFNEKGDSKLEITGKPADTTGLELDDAAGWGLSATGQSKLEALNTAKNATDGVGADYDDQEAKNAAIAAAQQAYDAQLELDIKAGADKIEEAITAVDGAISTLRNWASEFGNNYSIVQSRESFTENLINVLTEGADKLTLADMNEESANMLALQTRQQLAINSLSLASQAAQSVLQLF